ncbi:hypothetical protein M3Y96_00995800 [Aphelenchoides besseyi]|nr:hypothetical protein M3Y96_00995800 [Aphelenchoides besseyi]
MVYHIHFCILMCLSIQAATAQTLLSNEFRRARQLFGAETIKSAAELATCQAIMTSINAQFFEQNVFIPPSTNLEDLKEELEPLEMQIIEEPPHEDDGKSRFGYTVDVDRSERIARTLRSSVYAKKICDPTRFHPYVVETGDASMSCYDVSAFDYYCKNTERLAEINNIKTIFAPSGCKNRQKTVESSFVSSRALRSLLIPILSLRSQD